MTKLTKHPVVYVPVKNYLVKKEKVFVLTKSEMTRIINNAMWDAGNGKTIDEFIKQNIEL